MPDLTVEVRNRDIIISEPSVGLSMTYRKETYTPMLVVISAIPDKPPKRTYEAARVADPRQ
jgi:hypothetical protein